MKIVSWNIAGGHTFNSEVSDAATYEKEDLNYFIQEIKKESPDFIGLQELHTSTSEGEKSQAEIIADELGLKYVYNVPYANSHINTKHQLSLGIISKYPIKNVEYHKTPNPHLIITRPNGDKWQTFDKGFIVSEIEVEGQSINFLNGHMLPLHYYKRDYTEPEFKNILDDVSNLLSQALDKPTIVTGDFNFSNLSTLFPELLNNNKYIESFTAETAPGKGQQDHILYSYHWKMENYIIKKLRADHYMCIVEVKHN